MQQRWRPKSDAPRLWQRQQRKHKVAARAVDDPVVLAKAARIVRIALARRVLEPADLEPQTPAERAEAQRAAS